ncbi:MAG: hypothetical protein O7G86_18795 [Gammaproteobacteria bacterium]|nr:hypothetical protein [Gammaproteobacteria bacterium]
MLESVRVSKPISPTMYLILAAFPVLLWPMVVSAHGGVVFEEDVCVLNIGFLQAHFTGYQPNSRGSEEFCEDLPDVGNSVFVIDYLHDFLKEMPVDFRIVTDSQNLGMYARWSDIQALPNIERDTVFYHPPRKWLDGVLNVSHDFQESGGYIGIITARHPTEEKLYNAVFFFEVGGTGYGYLPLFVGFAVFAQLLYWWNKGGFKRFRPNSNR